MSIYNSIVGGGGLETLWEGNYEFSGGSSTTNALQIYTPIVLSEHVGGYILVVIEETSTPISAARSTGGWFVGYVADFGDGITADMGGVVMANDGYSYHPQSSPFISEYEYGNYHSLLYFPRANVSSLPFLYEQVFSVKIYKLA